MERQDAKPAKNAKIRNLQREPFPVYYNRVLVAESRLDLLVGEQLVAELKAVEELRPLSSCRICGRASSVRLLFNFNVYSRHAIRRLFGPEVCLAFLAGLASWRSIWKSPSLTVRFARDALTRAQIRHDRGALVDRALADRRHVHLDDAVVLHVVAKRDRRAEVAVELRGR